MQTIRALLLCVFVTSLGYTACAQTPAIVNNPDLTISPVLKKFEEKKNNVTTKNGAMITEKEEQWGYVTTIENKSFKPIGELQIKYIVFYKQDQIGVKSAVTLKRQTGSGIIPALPSSGKEIYTTDHLKLKKEVLNGNYYFASGAKNRAEDCASGIWIRLYQNGTIVAETVSPLSLTNKEKWE